jgi:hypothetical protein
MGTAATIVGCILILTGAVWTLQGLNVLGGSFMSGQTLWLVIGVVVAVLGASLIVWARSKRR